MKLNKQIGKSGSDLVIIKEPALWEMPVKNQHRRVLQNNEHARLLIDKSYFCSLNQPHSYAA
jgi:hypothetical protein